MPKIAAGVEAFRQDGYQKRKDLYAKLAGGQSPEVLMITCSDSRISPTLITSAEPGEVFVIRNAGNIVPPYKDAGGGETATIEYAVAALKVKHIVVCGHTGCGAMAAAMDPSGLDALPQVKSWIGHADEAVSKVKGSGGDMHALLRANAEQQVQHLHGHPYVKKAVEAGELTLHAWVYDIGEGQVEAHTEDGWKPVSEAYADAVSSFAAQVTGQEH